jgi:uncharacterized Zn finger protein
MGRWRDWGYYEPAQPKPVKDGIKARTQRGAIGETWWSKRWIEVLESFQMGARLARGRAYARKGQVVSIDVKKGLVTAKVQGTRAKPYSVKIALNPLSEDAWDKVTDAMVSQAVFAARLLSGEMPRNIEEAFAEVEVPLFPASERELGTDCSCPDWANPCKHIAAVYYLLAERFDDDPFLIFKLRGRTREEIIEILREKRAQTLPKEASTIVEADSSQESAAMPLEECLDTFWQTGEALDSFAVHPAPRILSMRFLRDWGMPPLRLGNTTSSVYWPKPTPLPVTPH